MNVYVSEFTTYYWYCNGCGASEDCETESAAYRGKDEHVCAD